MESGLFFKISDGYTTDDITYLWKDKDPVQIAQGLSLPRFSIEKYASSYCTVSTNTGKSPEETLRILHTFTAKISLQRFYEM